MAEDCDELNLLAFRYVAGEMLPDEAGEFELRLAEDQAAREAVSRAVKLAQLLAEAGPVDSAALVTPSSRSKLLRSAIAPLGWIGAGTAAALVAVSLAGWPQGAGVQPGSLPGGAGLQPAGTPNDTPLTSPRVDALVWAQLQASHDWAAGQLDEELEVSPTIDADPAAGVEIPAWVFTVSTPSKTREQP